MKIEVGLKRVLLITEYINPPFDEGIKKTVYNLYKELDFKHDLMVLCRYGFEKNNIRIVKTNPLFLSFEVLGIMRQFKPETIIYFPFQSSTFGSYIRQYVFSQYSKASKMIFVALQPKPIRRWQMKIARGLFRSTGITASKSLHSNWKEYGFKSYLVPLYTDLSQFKILDSHSKRDRKSELREKYGLPKDKFIISHMGHLTEGRNLVSLLPLQRAGYQVLIVSSSSTPSDALDRGGIRDTLLEAGVIIIERSLENIEEVYQLSDLYIFPVVNENSSIGMPLSIMEARACGLPVLTTDYGSVRHYFGNDNGGITYSVPDEFLNKLNELAQGSNEIIPSEINEINEMFYKRIQELISQ